MSSIFSQNPFFTEFGYEEKTTFWSDFSIADLFGEDGIKDTYERAKQSWQDNIEYMTELAMVLNHKSWFWNEKKPQFCKLYADLWREIDNFILEHFENDKGAIAYYLRVTD